MHSDKPYTLLFDAEGAEAGVWISPDLWHEVQAQVLPLLDAASGAEPKAVEEKVVEPLADWDTLSAYWDFPYPLERSVTCGHCGASTEDWQADDPRRFHLKSATFGGLVSFQCRACKARVIKRHFKDGVQVETKPFVE